MEQCGSRTARFASRVSTSCWTRCTQCRSVSADDRLADPRYRRLIEATRDLAAQGYDAVSMREPANVTHMSLTTIYQLGGSKDQLIAEAHADRMVKFREQLSRRPPTG